MHRRSAAVLLVAVLSLAFAAQRGSVNVPAGGVTVPMLDFGGRPVVEVSVNGQGPYRMIVDTGASRTVIGPEWVGGRTGSIRVDELRIGSLAWTNAGVESADILGGNVPADFPRGVLSAEAFPGYLVSFDYPGKTFTIRKGALPAADGKRVFEYPADDDPLPRAPIRVAGHEITLHVDTGSPGGVMLPTRYAAELPIEGELKKLGTARTVAGAFDVFVAPVRGAIELGEFALDVPQVRFSDLRPGPKPGIGNIGYEVLRTFTLTVDASNRRLQFTRSHAAALDGRRPH